MRNIEKIKSALCLVILAILLLGKIDWYSSADDHYYETLTFTTGEEPKVDLVNQQLSAAERKVDSIKRIKRLKIDGFNGFSGYMSEFVGEIVPLRGPRLLNEGAPLLYLGSLGLKIDEDYMSKRYLVYSNRNGTGYLTRTKVVKKGKDNFLYFIEKKAPFQYSSEKNAILIPYKSPILRFFVIAVMIIFAVLILAAVLFIIVTFGRFLIAISKNLAFDEGNIQRLKDMSIALLILSLYSYVVHGIIFLVFSLNYPTDGVTLTYSFWERDYLTLIAAVLCYLIYTAFQKGMLLQQESELTI